MEKHGNDNRQLANAGSVDMTPIIDTQLTGRGLRVNVPRAVFQDLWLKLWEKQRVR
jgi:hypothetical protein